MRSVTPSDVLLVGSMFLSQLVQGGQEGAQGQRPPTGRPVSLEALSVPQLAGVLRCAAELFPNVRGLGGWGGGGKGV